MWPLGYDRQTRWPMILHSLLQDALRQATLIKFLSFTKHSLENNYFQFMRKRGAKGEYKLKPRDRILHKARRAYLWWMSYLALQPTKITSINFGFWNSFPQILHCSYKQCFWNQSPKNYIACSRLSPPLKRDAQKRLEVVLLEAPMSGTQKNMFRFIFVVLSGSCRCYCVTDNPVLRPLARRESRCQKTLCAGRKRGIWSVGQICATTRTSTSTEHWPQIKSRFFAEINFVEIATIGSENLGYVKFA